VSSQTQAAVKRLTAPEIRARKGQTPLVVLTAYSAPMAEIMDEHCDILLVGDSVGMVVHGLPNTIGVTLEMMSLHGQAVMRRARKSFVVIDVPFGSYEAGPEQAFANAVRLLKETGAQAVKVESGPTVADTIRYLVQRGIPVMGHVGLRPQAVNAEGGFKAKGRTQAERERVINEALATDEAGAFAIVIEGVAEDLAAEITTKVAAPTIGIGASKACDGQVLVTDDMLGLFTDFKPRFVKHFANLAPQISKAAEQYATEVRARAFPDVEHTYQMKRQKL
jgi:3-methyl-2-oxobutanoate hydroxymethyltransferase